LWFELGKLKTLIWVRDQWKTLESNAHQRRCLLSEVYRGIWIGSFNWYSPLYLLLLDYTLWSKTPLLDTSKLTPISKEINIILLLPPIQCPAFLTPTTLFAPSALLMPPKSVLAVNLFDTGNFLNSSLSFLLSIYHIIMINWLLISSFDLFNFGLFIVIIRN
jgi:hypothetical protein